MSNELTTQGTSGSVVYGIGFCLGQVLRVSSAALETYNASSYSAYVITMTEQGVSGRFFGSIPVGTPAGDYDFYFYQRDGSSPAEGDTYIGNESVHWSGTAVTSDSSVIDNGVALISLNELKAYLRLTSSNENSILSTLLNAASQWVRNYVKRNLVQATYTEYYSGDGSFELQLKNYPIVSVTSINIDQLRQFAASNLVDITNNVIVKKDAGILRAFNLLYGFTWGESNIKVIYSAGYNVSTNMPYDIRLAVKRIIDHQFRTGYTHRKLDHQSESIGTANITFRENDIPKDAKSILDRYVKLIPAPQYEYAD